MPVAGCQPHWLYSPIRGVCRDDSLYASVNSWVLAMTLQDTAWAWDQDVPAREKLFLLAWVEIVGDAIQWQEWHSGRIDRLCELTGLSQHEALCSLWTLLGYGLIDSRGGLAIVTPADLLTYMWLRIAPEATHVMEQPPGTVQVEASKSPQEGYIYLLNAEQYYKIGRTKDTDKRARQLAIQLPFIAPLISEWPVDDYVAAEKFIHRSLAHMRANGEWFDFGDTDLDDVIRTVSHLISEFEAAVREAYA